MQAIITQLQQLGTRSPWKPTMWIWCEFYWVKKWVRSRSKKTKFTMMEKKDKRKRGREKIIQIQNIYQQDAKIVIPIEGPHYI